MNTTVKLYSKKENEIFRFLKSFYSFSQEQLKNEHIEPNTLEWETYFENPIEMANIIGVYTENSDDFQIRMWICLDPDMYIQVTDDNADDIIRYLYERFPY